MAKCFALEDYNVEITGGRCFVTLEGWDPEAVEAFARIVVSAFPESKFRRTTARPETFLGLQHALRLVGDRPTGGGPPVNALLELVSRSQTIEDTLDESHSLAYHQDQDETTGLLKPSSLGRLVDEAKYGNHSRKARERIGEAMCEFFQRHPRYREADFIAAIPSHGAGRTYGLSGRLAQQVAEALHFPVVPIERVAGRVPQKNISDSDRTKGVRNRFANQRGSMLVSNAQLPGKRAILIDDIYGSGGTLHEGARALQQAGAKEILGLTATKQRLFGGVRVRT